MIPRLGPRPNPDAPWYAWPILAAALGALYALDWYDRAREWIGGRR